MKFKQAIHIEGRNMYDVFRLPCVAAIHKTVFGSIVYDLYGFVMADGSRNEAATGDWLCEDNEGKWYVMTNEEYERR